MRLKPPSLSYTTNFTPFDFLTESGIHLQSTKQIPNNPFTIKNHQCAFTTSKVTGLLFFHFHHLHRYLRNVPLILLPYTIGSGFSVAQHFSMAAYFLTIRSWPLPLLGNCVLSPSLYFTLHDWPSFFYQCFKLYKVCQQLYQTTSKKMQLYKFWVQSIKIIFCFIMLI